VYGTSADGPDVPGDTATAHVRRALARAGFDDAVIDAGLARWCDVFSARYVELLSPADTSHWERSPHAVETIAALERPALLTGNPGPVAHARMERLGLATFFPVGHGAFGCERESRVELFAWRASVTRIGRRHGRSRSATRRWTSRPRTKPAAGASP
jgi:phosphoglycolate phosphatase-like HAD superfamily hydrolase